MDAQERLTVDEATAPTLLGAMHVHRYQVAAGLCQGLRVVDLGCGSGYGTAILARVCPSVVGVDVDERTIRLAQEAFAHEDGIEFEIADAHDFLRNRLRDHFDAVVMLETLEHLENIDDAIGSLRRQADDGLRLVVSIPNSKMLEEDNPFHLTSFGYDETRAAFDGFPNVTLLFQFIAEGSLVRAGDESGKSALELTGHGEPEYANQFLVLVNHSEEDVAQVSALMRLEAEPVHHRYVRTLERANAELRVVNAKLARDHLGKANSAAAALVARTRALEAELSDARRLEHKEWIESLHRQIEEGRQRIEAMESSRAWRLAERYRRVRRGFRRPTQSD